jgi:hypothetical protein
MDKELLAPKGEVLKTAPPITSAHIHQTIFIDTMGIPLTSDRGDLTHTQGIDFKYVPNNFKDSPSRYPNGRPHPIPMSGLEKDRLEASYGSLLPLVGRVRQNFIQYSREETGIEPSEPLNVDEALKVLFGLAYLPHYLVYRTRGPFAPMGQIPFEIFILSNAAEGSRASIAAFMEENRDDPELFARIPDVEEAIDASERLKRMVGDKTVCVASPKQMKHFIGSVIDGSEKLGECTFEEILPDDEIRSLVEFSSGYFDARLRTNALQNIDEWLAANIQDALEKKIDTRRINQAIQPYYSHIQKLLRELTGRESDMNRALGRQPHPQTLTLKDLKKDIPLQLPDIFASLS